MAGMNRLLEKEPLVLSDVIYFAQLHVIRIVFIRPRCAI